MPTWCHGEAAGPRDRRADLAPAGVRVPWKGGAPPAVRCCCRPRSGLAHTGLCQFPCPSSSLHPEGGSSMPCHYRWGPGPRVAVVLCFRPGSAHSEAQRAPSGWVGLGTERPQAPRSTLHTGVASAHSAPSTPCAETHLPRGVHLRAPRLDEGLPASDSEEPPRWGVPRAKCFLSVGMAQAVLLWGRGGGGPGCH